MIKFEKSNLVSFENPKKPLFLKTCSLNINIWIHLKAIALKEKPTTFITLELILNASLEGIAVEAWHLCILNIVQYFLIKQIL